MTKPISQDIKALGMLVRGCKMSTPRMVEANLRFVWDKYVVHRELESMGLTDKTSTVQDTR